MNRPYRDSIFLNKAKLYSKEDIEKLLHMFYGDMTTDSNYDGVWFDEWIDKHLK